MTDDNITSMALCLLAADADMTYRDAQDRWPSLNAYQQGAWWRMAHAALSHIGYLVPAADRAAADRAAADRPTADRAVRLYAAHCGYTLEAAPALYAAAHPSVRRYWERLACV